MKISFLCIVFEEKKIKTRVSALSTVVNGKKSSFGNDIYMLLHAVVVIANLNSLQHYRISDVLNPMEKSCLENNEAIFVRC